MSFDFKEINILIGEQGTGKGTVAKMIAAINKMASGETLAVGSSGLMRLDEYGKPDHFKRHLKIYNIDDYLNELTEISYQHTLFKFEYSNNYCGIAKSKTTSGEEVVLDYLNITFIPADRIAVTLLSNELLYSLNEINQDLPGYFVRFGQLFNRLKKSQRSFDFTDTLGVVYRYEDDIDKIEIQGNKQIRMSNASSAIQTNIPLLVILNHQSQNGYEDFYTADLNISIIEEPELNCFPVLQNSMLKNIIKSIQTSVDKFKRRILITTHSPYILTSLNNLMYAYQVGQKNKEEANKIIEEKYWVNPNDVSAYQLLIDGTCRDILDREESMIEADKIDEVSRIINQQFDNLMNIEFEKA